MWWHLLIIYWEGRGQEHSQGSLANQPHLIAPCPRESSCIQKHGQWLLRKTSGWPLTFTCTNTNLCHVHTHIWLTKKNQIDGHNAASTSTVASVGDFHWGQESKLLVGHKILWNHWKERKLSAFSFVCWMSSGDFIFHSSRKCLLGFSLYQERIQELWIAVIN